MSDAERKPWRHLRRLPMEKGYLRRQATIEQYFANFAGHQCRLVIEVDGSGHGEDRQIAADAHRAAYLRPQGYRMLRFWNNEVLNEIDGVMSVIYAALRGVAGSAPPAPDPYPPRAARAGEGESKRRA
jgi:very-short-patch-repair endonuclease